MFAVMAYAITVTASFTTAINNIIKLYNRSVSRFTTVALCGVKQTIQNKLIQSLVKSMLRWRPYKPVLLQKHREKQDSFFYLV